MPADAVRGKRAFETLNGFILNVLPKIKRHVVNGQDMIGTRVVRHFDGFLGCAVPGEFAGLV